MSHTSWIPGALCEQVIIGGSMSLSRIFNQKEIIFFCQVYQWTHICHLPKHVYHNDSRSFITNGYSGFDRINSVRLWINIYEDRNKAQLAECAIVWIDSKCI